MATYVAYSFLANGLVAGGRGGGGVVVLRAWGAGAGRVDVTHLQVDAFLYILKMKGR